MEACGSGKKQGKREVTDGSLENCVFDVLQTLTVSTSESTRSSRWVVMAAPSTAAPEPEVPTRSVISKMMLV